MFRGIRVNVSSLKTLALVVLATVFFVSGRGAQAVPYFEQGDAGQSLVTSQTVFGFTSISGALQSDPLSPDPFDLVDLYGIFIISPASFDADTGMGSDLTRVADPALFLLDFSGRGIVMDDDRDTAPPGSSGSQSHLGPLPSAFLPGFYFLGISFSGVYPLDTGGQFILDPFASQRPAHYAGGRRLWHSIVLGLRVFEQPQHHHRPRLSDRARRRHSGTRPPGSWFSARLLALPRAQSVEHKHRPV